MKILEHNLLGLRLHAMTTEDIVSVVSRAIQRRERYIVANHNLHSVYLCHRENEARSFYRRADYIHIDGMALVALGRLSGLPLQREHRSTYVDLLPTLLAAAEANQWRVFYLGSKPGVAEHAAQKLRNTYPKLLMMTRHGYFETDPTGSQNAEVLNEIKAYAPQLLLVGMGMPRQENWVAENWHRLSCNAALCCGAALDYVSGEIPTPPRWIGKIGFEWLYRLASEPKRLWRRYLVEPWFLLGVMLRHSWGSARLNGLREPSNEQ